MFVKNKNFTKDELQYFDVYKVNDTLVFQSLKNNSKDTSVIVYKNLRRHYNPIVSAYNEQCMNITYINKRFKYLDYQVKNETLVFDCKTNVDAERPFYLYLTYLRSDFRIDTAIENRDLVTLTLSHKSFKNVYQSKYQRLKFHSGTDDDPEILYWDQEYGIIKYITFNGEVWERVNWY